MTSRLVYTTHNQTVTIDYDQTLHLFLTDKEHHPFSAERMVRMLNGWAKVNKVTLPVVGRCHIKASQAHCILSKAAMTTLSHLYSKRRDWQIEYPFVADVLAEPLFLRSISISEQALGFEHPRTQNIRGNYILLLRATGHDEEAKQMEEDS